MKEKISREITIAAQNLQVNYGDFVALQINDLAIKGHIIALVGHNGSGKSTLIKTLLQLLNPRRGKLSSHFATGQAARQLVPHESMAFSPEEGAIFEDLTVYSYLQLWCRLKRIDGDWFKNEGEKLIEQFQLASLLPKYGRQLSKGQRRRVQMAVGFLTKPEFFLFDEPFDGLDIEQTSRLVDILEEKAADSALLISSHRMEIVERLADAVIVLKEGKLSAAGSISTVCQNLCPLGFSISVGADYPQRSSLQATLKEHLRPAIVYPHPSGLTIYGQEFSIAKLEQIVESYGLNKLCILPTKASLVEAMHYHLLGGRTFPSIFQP